MDKNKSFTPFHRLSKSLLRETGEGAGRALQLSSMEWRERVEEAGALDELLEALLRAARMDSSRAANEMSLALDARAPTRQRESAALGAAFKTACVAGLWELAQWRCERDGERGALPEGAGKKLEAIGALGALALGSLGALTQRLQGEGERSVLERAQRVDGMVGFPLCHESMVQWRVLEERRQLDEQTGSGAIASKAASHRI